MIPKVLSSEKARIQWREVLDTAVSGNDVVIERYGKPAVAIIPYQDFLELADVLQEMREVREAQQVYDAWQNDPTSARPWNDVEADLIADGLLDE
jgi:prevent-host-death family protein